MSLLNYSNRELVERSKFLRNNMTKAEILLWSKLRSKQLQGFKFRRQQPIFNYIVDFYCAPLKLIVEIDGKVHSDSKDYDKSRENFFLRNRFHILRFENDQVEFEIEDVLDQIRTRITELSLEANSKGFSINGT